jgi:hypothetical protein
MRASPPLQRELYRYAHTLMVQISQTAACNRFHIVQTRLARWLPMTHDRMKSNQFRMTQEFLGHMCGVRRPASPGPPGAAEAKADQLQPRHHRRSARPQGPRGGGLPLLRGRQGHARALAAAEKNWSGVAAPVGVLQLLVDATCGFVVRADLVADHAADGCAADYADALPPVSTPPTSAPAPAPTAVFCSRCVMPLQPSSIVAASALMVKF